MLEWPDFTDHLAYLEKAAGVELGVPSLHGFHMIGMGAPGLQCRFGGEPEDGYFLAIIRLERLDRLKAGKIADDTVHALAQTVVFLLRRAFAHLQISDDDHFPDHSLSSSWEMDAAPPAARCRPLKFDCEWAFVTPPSDAARCRSARPHRSALPTSRWRRSRSRNSRQSLAPRRRVAAIWCR